MNGNISHDAQDSSLNSSEAASIASASAPALRKLEAAAQNLFRIDTQIRFDSIANLFRHSSRKVRFTVYGIALALAGLLGLAMIDAAKTLSNTQITLSALIHAAMTLLLGSVFAGTAIVIAAHKSDRRITTAADLDQVMGLEPIVQLPDLTEVSGDGMRGYLAQMAPRVEESLRDRKGRNCIVTAASHGAGATTVAWRIKEIFDILGKVSVVRDGTGENASMALEDAAAQPGEIVLIDTDPITESKETAHLARHADCVIVVLESGETTRSQLLAVANSLKRCHVPLAGYIVNRVRQANADESLRSALENIEPNRHFDEWSSENAALQALHTAVESGRATLQVENAAGMNAATAPLEDRYPVPATEVNTELQSTVEATPAPPAIPASSRESSRTRKKLPPASDGIPWWLREKPVRIDPADPSGYVPQPVSQQPVASHLEHWTAQKRSDLPVFEENSPASPLRISDLRSSLIPVGPKHLDSDHQSARNRTEAERLLSVIAPFEALFEPKNPALGTAHPYAAEGEKSDSRHFLPVSEQGNTTSNPGIDGAFNALPQHIANQRDFPASELLANESSGVLLGGNNDPARRAQSYSIYHSSGSMEDVRILPSKRGQYSSNEWEQRNGQR